MALYRTKKAMTVEGWKPPTIVVERVNHPSKPLRQRHGSSRVTTKAKANHKTANP